jgi:hypothetical protein
LGRRPPLTDESDKKDGKFRTSGPDSKHRRRANSTVRDREQSQPQRLSRPHWLPAGAGGALLAAAPPVPGSPSAARAEAFKIGQQWGQLLADRDMALNTLQTKYGGVSVWDRMTTQEKKDFAKKAQDQFALLPILPQYADPNMISAQDDGFQAGVAAGYSFEQFKAFVQELTVALALYLFSELVVAGIRLPTIIRQVLGRALAGLGPARTAEEAVLLVEKIRIQEGEVIYNIGGRAAPGEPAGAINVNDEILPGGIPNQVVSKGEYMDKLLPANSGDSVYSRNLVGDIDWNQMARASKIVVKNGGTVTLSPWGGQLGELPQIKAAMEAAGFRNVRIEYGAVVKGVR